MRLTDRAAYSIPQVIELTSLGRDKIYDLIRKRKLQAKKVGRRTIVTASDLRSCLEALPPFGSEEAAE